MDNLSTPHIDGHMAAVANQVSRLSIGIAYFLPVISLLTGGSGQIDTKLLHDVPGEGAAVYTILNVCPAIHIGISDKLSGVIYHVRAADPCGKGWVLASTFTAGTGIPSVGATSTAVVGIPGIGATPTAIAGIPGTRAACLSAYATIIIVIIIGLLLLLLLLL